VSDRELSRVAFLRPQSGLGVRGWLDAAARVFGSYGLAVGLLVLLTLLTLFGTLAQKEKSLFDVQAEYFESIVVWVSVGPIPLPLPGAYLILVVLALNLIVGGLVRIRKGWRTAGILVVHVGMLTLLGGGLWEYVASERGSLRLFEGQSGAHFVDSERWDLAIEERRGPDLARTFLVPLDAFADAGPGEERRFTHPDLPFTLAIGDYVRNARPKVAEERHDGAPSPAVLVDVGPDRKEAGNNVPGFSVRLLEPGGKVAGRALLWGRQRAAWRVEVDGRTFDVDLIRRAYALPFEVRLDKFVKEDHPGTATPRRFSSYITRREGRVDTRIHITMNEPLRHRGYTLYQSGWGPQPGEVAPPYSVFQVVRNPADRVPLLACIVIAIGLLCHFVFRLVTFLERQARRPL
jgi:hypothetical protein